MPKATAQSTSTMPGAPAPTSRHADRLARLKLLRRKALTDDRKHRRFSKDRLQTAEWLLAQVIDSGDLIAEIISEGSFGRPDRTRELCLLVTFDPQTFERLCAFDAEAADFEDSGDAEEEADEPSLASTASLNQVKWSAGHPHGSQPIDVELDKADDEANGDAEPSLGSGEVIMVGGSDYPAPAFLNPKNTHELPLYTGVQGVSAAEVVRCNQEGWARGSSDDDRELDAAERGEPDCDAEPDERHWPRPREAPPTAPEGPVMLPSTDPVTGKPGAWLMLPRDKEGAK